VANAKILFAFRLPRKRIQVASSAVELAAKMKSEIAIRGKVIKDADIRVV